MRCQRGADGGEQRVEALQAALALPGCLLGVAVGALHGVVDVEVADLVRAAEQRALLVQLGEEPGGDCVELPAVTEGERAQEPPGVDGARTRSNNRCIAPCRSTSMSWIESVPTISPATSEVSFTGAFAAPGPASVRCSVSSSCNPARSAKARTGTNPADGTRWGHRKQSWTRETRGPARCPSVGSIWDLQQSHSPGPAGHLALTTCLSHQRYRWIQAQLAQRSSWCTDWRGHAAHPRRAVIEPSMKRSPGSACRASAMTTTVPGQRSTDDSLPGLLSGCHRAATIALTNPSRTAPTRSAMRRRLWLSANRSRVARPM